MRVLVASLLLGLAACQAPQKLELVMLCAQPNPQVPVIACRGGAAPAGPER